MNFKLEMLNTQLIYHAKIKHTEMHSKQSERHAKQLSDLSEDLQRRAK